MKITWRVRAISESRLEITFAHHIWCAILISFFLCLRGLITPLWCWGRIWALRRFLFCRWWRQPLYTSWHRRKLCYVECNESEVIQKTMLSSVIACLVTSGLKPSYTPAECMASEMMPPHFCFNTVIKASLHESKCLKQWDKTFHSGLWDLFCVRWASFLLKKSGGNIYCLYIVLGERHFHKRERLSVIWRSITAAFNIKKRFGHTFWWPSFSLFYK